MSVDNSTSWVGPIASRWDFTPEFLEPVLRNVREAFERLADGSGSDDDYDLVASALNVSMVRAEMVGAGPLIEAVAKKQTTRATPLQSLIVLSLDVWQTMDKAQHLIHELRVGMGALVAADIRKAQHGKFGFDGPGLVAMRAALDRYEDIVRMSTGRQMTLASEEVARRARAQEQGS